MGTKKRVMIKRIGHLDAVRREKKGAA